LANAGVWVAPTDSFRDLVARHYNVSNGVAIWNGIEDVYHRSGSKQPVILSAGRVWDRAKNILALASIAAHLDWPVRIAGSAGENREGIAVPPGCEFLGEIAHGELMREMQAASIFVSPAWYEPFGLSVLEAARAGCALVLSDIPTFRELWDGAAIFIDPGDGEELQHVLRGLCVDEVNRARLQRVARERAGRYSLRNTAHSYARLYQSLLAGNCRFPRIERAGVPA
jgi:glycosyltransferase involved in cell wall biosynthesis